MKKLNWMKYLLLLCSFAVACLLFPLSGNSQNSLPSKNDISFVPPHVERNDTTNTVDLYLRAKRNNQLFWDFDEDELKAFEIVNGKKIELEVFFKGPVTNVSKFKEGGERYLVQTRSERNYHREPRNYIVYWYSNDGAMIDSTSHIQNWSDAEAFNLVDRFSFLDALLIGLLSIAVLLLVLSEFIPLLRIYNFYRKFVFPYSKVQKKDERKLNPITGRPIPPDEKVVVKCDRENCGVPLRVWKQKNYQCFHCPDICEGSVNVGFKEFFDQLGIFRRLNWLWFGALGGLLAFLIYFSIINLFDLDPGKSDHSVWIYVTLGFSIGVGLTSMLAWVEERGEGTFSRLKIFSKTLIGAIVSTALFFIAHNVQSSEYQLGNLGIAFFWLLNCVFIGGILSFWSSVSRGRGVLSGLIAGLVSSIGYFLILLLFPDPDAEMSRILTLVIAGGLLGLVIIQVITQLDKIELEVLSPKYRKGLVYSLDNYLNSNENVIIGSDMKRSQARVKWDDTYVYPQHAELTMNNNRVFIKPLGDAEILVNDRLLVSENSQQLNGGEKIQLGRHSHTVFKYTQKGSKEN